jgi:dolichyl-phosphate beta-glucosyltransferase
MKLSIIIPAYNEEKRLAHTIKGIIRFLKANHLDYELILVDDGSTDSTHAQLKKFVDGTDSVKLLHYKKNRGKGFAVRTGVLASSGEYVFFMDADGSTPIDELSKLLKELIRGTPVVIGSRHLPTSSINKNQPLYRRFFGRLANFIIRLLLLPGIYDSQCGFKGFSRDAAISLFTILKTYRWGFDFEILTRARRLNYLIVEVPVSWFHQEGSRMSPIKSFIKTFYDLIYVLIVVRILKR